MGQPEELGAQLLKDIRAKTGWNRETIASRLGVSLMTLYRWEKGQNKPSPLAVQKLRELLKQVS